MKKGRDTIDRRSLAAEVDAIAKQSLSDSAHRALRFDWAAFEEWCDEQGLSPLPAEPETVAGFVTDQAKSKSVATIQRYLASVAKKHRLERLPSPVDDRVREVMAGVRRAYGTRQHRKEPLTFDIISKLRGEGLEFVRDRALLLMGVASAFRATELCSVDVEDVEWRREGAVALLRKAKTDQEKAGVSKGIPFVHEDESICPGCALRAWLKLLGAKRGPVFRRIAGGEVTRERLTRDDVSDVVKSAVASCRLDASEYGSHSLRAGYVTEARRAGLDWTTIMVQTGHKKLETVQRYDRGTIDPFRESRVADVFRASIARRKEEEDAE